MADLDYLLTIILVTVVPFAAALTIAHRMGRTKVWLWTPIVTVLLITLGYWVMSGLAAGIAGQPTPSINLRLGGALRGAFSLVLAVFLIVLAIAGPKRKPTPAVEVF